jgi:hypothetical protein
MTLNEERRGDGRVSGPGRDYIYIFGGENGLQARTGRGDLFYILRVESDQTRHVDDAL